MTLTSNHGGIDGNERAYQTAKWAISDNIVETIKSDSNDDPKEEVRIL